MVAPNLDVLSMPTLATLLERCAQDMDTRAAVLRGDGFYWACCYLPFERNGAGGMLAALEVSDAFARARSAVLREAPYSSSLALDARALGLGALNSCMASYASGRLACPDARRWVDALEDAADTRLRAHGFDPTPWKGVVHDASRYGPLREERLAIAREEYLRAGPRD